MSTPQYPFVLDADSHWHEPADLFTRNAPPAWRDRMPRVEQREVPGFLSGEPELRQCWVVGDRVIGPDSAAVVIDRDGNKGNPNIAMFTWPYENGHDGAHEVKARLRVLDECGIDAQIVFPGAVGLGGQNFGSMEDRAAAEMALQVYNDVEAEMQAESRDRMLMLPLMPAWDVDKCIAEAKRCAAMGMRGINMTSEPSDVGGVDLGNRAWDPFWEVCTENRLPVHFHIGASATAATFHSAYTWKSHNDDLKLAMGGAMQFIGNAAVAMNFVMSGIFDRHPDLKVVSVESGAGWVPFAMEAIEYEMMENSPDDLKKMKKRPMEYFRSNMYATFWFEKNLGYLQHLVDTVGEDNILFETDYPHPTCLYPDPLQIVSDKMKTIAPEAQRKIMGENGKKLYRL